VSRCAARAQEYFPYNDKKTLPRFTNSLPPTSFWCVWIKESFSGDQRDQTTLSYFFVCLLAAPLLLAQDSDSKNSQTTNIGGAWQLSWQGRGGSQQATVQIQQDDSELSGTFQQSAVPLR